jgi:hypothetical protein
MATAFNVVIKAIEERRDDIAQALISGAAKDYPEYKSMSGEIRGLAIAHAFIQDIVKKLEQADE